MNRELIQYQQDLGCLKALFLCSAFNGLAQKVWVNLKTRFHQSVLMLGIHEEALHRFQPDLIICPFLTEYLPESIWHTYPSFIIHPGPPGEGGPSSLNWAVLRAETKWGVSIIQADRGWDSGPVWGAGEFELPQKSISKIYRAQVADTVLKILPEALNRYFASGSPITYSKLTYRPKIKEADLCFEWQEKSNTLLKKINAGDSLPGAVGTLSGRQFKFYGAELDRVEFKTGRYKLTDSGELQIGTGDGSIRISRIAGLDGIKVRPEILLSN